MKPALSIEYCPKCGWLLRATYVTQKLFTTFTDDIYGIMLQPSEISDSFIIRVEELEIFNRKKSGRFPEIKELKQLVRDIVNPEKSLGHSDKKNQDEI